MAAPEICKGVGAKINIVDFEIIVIGPLLVQCATATVTDVFTQVRFISSDIRMCIRVY